METSLDKTLVEFGLTPGADNKYYDDKEIVIDNVAKNEIVDIGENKVTLNNMYKNEVAIESAMRYACGNGLRQIDNAMNNISNDGAFKQASDTVALVIAETIKKATTVYALSDESLDTLILIAKKSIADLNGFVSAAYDQYRDSSTKVAIEKSARDQVMAAESIARASEVKSSSTTISGDVKFSGIGYGRDYGTYSFGSAYGSGGISGTANTTYQTGMSHLSDDLETDAMASASIGFKDQMRVNDNAAGAIHDCCYKTMNEFIKVLLKMLVEAHSDLLAYPDNGYGDLEYWVKLTKGCTEQDVDKINGCMEYYGQDVREVWERSIGEEIYNYLMQNKLSGVYESELLQCYLKALNLKEFQPFEDLSGILADEIISAYEGAHKYADVDADSATELVRLGDVAQKSIYLTDKDKEQLKSKMRGTKKAVRESRIYSIQHLITNIVMVLGIVVAVVFMAVPNVMLFQGKMPDSVGWEYLGLVGGASVVAGTAFSYRKGDKTLFSALLRGIGTGILGIVVFFIVTIICVIATGNMKW